MKDLVKKAKQDGKLSRARDYRYQPKELGHKPQRFVCKLLAAVVRATNSKSVTVEITNEQTDTTARIQVSQRTSTRLVGTNRADTKAKDVYDAMDTVACENTMDYLPMLAHRTTFNTNCKGGRETHVNHMLMPLVRLLEAQQDGLCNNVYLSIVVTPAGNTFLWFHYSRGMQPRVHSIAINPCYYSDAYYSNSTKALHPEFEKLRSLQQRDRLPMNIGIKQVNIVLDDIAKELDL